MKTWFEEVDLHIIEMPIEFIQELPVYKGFIRELPQITAEGSSRRELYSKLALDYQEYLDTHLVHEDKQEMTSSLLSTEELLKYYDGETFDGFELNI